MEVQQSEQRWDNWPGRRRRRSGTGGIMVGALIVAAGIIMLLDNMGIVYVRDLWRYWPVALIALGAARLVENRRPAALAWGGLLIAVGVLLLLRNLDIYRFEFRIIMPLVIVAFGVSMLLRAIDRNRIVGDSVVDVNSHVSLFAMFGGSKRRIDSSDFRGGEVFAIFGGFHLDLRGAQIPSGKAVVDINTMFGGCEIVVPDTWRVSSEGMGIFGGFEDKTLPPRLVEGTQPPVLVITGTALFGGVGVRN